MAEFEKQRNISYGARDFDQIKTELTSFVKQYFPSNYSDLSEGSDSLKKFFLTLLLRLKISMQGPEIKPLTLPLPLPLACC